MKRQNEIFNNTPEADEISGAKEIIERYKPEFLGEGGNHIVYRIPRYPNLVVKVHRRSLEHMEAYLQEHGLTAPDAAKLGEVETYVAKHRADRDQFAGFFPRGRVLPERIFFAQVPVPGPRLPDGTSQFSEKLGWGIVRVQEKIPVTGGVDYSLDSPYPEKRRVEHQDEVRYWKITERLLKGAPCATEDIFWIQRNIESHVERAERDPLYRKELEEFLRCAITYMAETGCFLDLVGKDNVVFQHLPDGSWRYLLVDALDGGLQVDDVLAIIKSVEVGDSIKEFPQSALINAFHSVRTINGLLTALDLPERNRSLASIATLSFEARSRIYQALHAPNI